MLGIHDLRLFIVSGLVLSITPEPDTAHIVGRSAQFGWRSGAAATLGIGSGCLVHVFACMYLPAGRDLHIQRHAVVPGCRRPFSADGASRFMHSRILGFGTQSVAIFEISRNRIAHPGRFA